MEVKGTYFIAANISIINIVFLCIQHNYIEAEVVIFYSTVVSQCGALSLGSGQVCVSLHMQESSGPEPHPAIQPVFFFFFFCRL